MNVSELRTRANAVLARARELETRAASDEGTPDDQVQLDVAINEAQALFDQATEAEARSARLRNLEQLAKAPAGRQGSPFVTGPHTDPANTRGRHQYSLMRAMQGELAQREGRGSFDGIERETHDHLVAMRGKPAAGLVVPWDASIQYRSDLTTSTGSGAIQTTVLPNLIDLLRAKLVLSSMGAHIVTDMNGPFQFPKITADSTSGWVSTEGTGVSGGAPTIGQVSFSWKSVEASAKLTRQFIASTSLDGEALLADQLVRKVAQTIEQGCLTGTGSSGQPKGLFTYSSGDGIGTLVLGTNGAKPTYNDFVNLAAKVDTANAPADNRYYLINPTLRAYTQTTPKIGTTYPSFILDQNNTIGGYQYQSTSNVPNNLTKGTSTSVCSAMAFGCFSELVIAMFSGLDVFLDPYSAQPHVNIKVVQDVDINFLHLGSFATSVDALTA